MKYKLNKWNDSNYEIELILNDEIKAEFRKKILKNFQKDVNVSWFRKGHVPLDMVAEQVKPEYIEMWIYEEAVSEWTKLLIKDNPDIKFIWQLYDLTIKEDKDWAKNIIVFKLDVYPDVEVTNDNWKTLKVTKISTKITKDEITKAMDNLKKQYATYQDKEDIQPDYVTKIRFVYKDKTDKIVSRWSSFIAKEDFDEFEVLKEIFVGKKIKEKFEMDYDEKKLPKILQNTKKEVNLTKIEFEIMEIKEVILPTFDEAKLKELFANENITNEKELEKKIEEVLKQQKEEWELIKTMDDLTTKLSSSISITIPKTLVVEEKKSRIKQLYQRFWWEEWYKKYIVQIWEEKTKEMEKEIEESAKVSLWKYFIFQKYAELLELSKDIDWQKPLDPERKIYDKLIGNETNQENDKKEENKSDK